MNKSFRITLNAMYAFVTCTGEGACGAGTQAFGAASCKSSAGAEVAGAFVEAALLQAHGLEHGTMYGAAGA